MFDGSNVKCSAEESQVLESRDVIVRVAQHKYPVIKKYSRHYGDNDQPQQAPEVGEHSSQDLSALVSPGEHRREADQASAPETDNC